MRPAGQPVRLARTADVPALADVLAAAFLDDPVWAFVVTGSRRRDRLRRLFALLLTFGHLPDGAVWCDDRRRAVAAWSPPDRWREAGSRMAAHAEAVAELYGERLPAIARFLAAIEDHHPDEEHWYLPVLATAPGVRGRGLATAALGPVLERCDADGVPAYLEASTATNVAFYRRRGFSVMDELRPLRRGPVVWPMWRAPFGGRVARTGDGGVMPGLRSGSPSPGGRR